MSSIDRYKILVYIIYPLGCTGGGKGYVSPCRKENDILTSLREVVYISILSNLNKHICLFTFLIKYSFFFYIFVILENDSFLHVSYSFLDKIRVIKKVNTYVKYFEIRKYFYVLYFILFSLK
jgi:hypothetical protein